MVLIFFTLQLRILSSSSSSATDSIRALFKYVHIVLASKINVAILLHHSVLYCSHYTRDYLIKPIMYICSCRCRSVRCCGRRADGIISLSLIHI